jgi:hypothetical protein
VSRLRSEAEEGFLIVAYDIEFFAQYAKYLKEPIVRHNHNQVFRWFYNMSEPLVRVAGTPKFFNHSVIDLGCGLNEFGQYGISSYYVGVDLAPSRIDNTFMHVQADYTKDENLWSKLPYKPNTFVSLFSAECCLNVQDRYALYRRLFANPDIKCGLSSGFYYKSKRHEETVGETGGIQSFQTIDDIGSDVVLDVQEVRLIMETPSKMFGPDVVEVWKVFLRT